MSTVIRHEQTDMNRHVVVIVNDSKSANEWMIIEGETNVAQSAACYGGATPALRDGLVYDECRQVIRTSDEHGEPMFLGESPWVHARENGRRINAIK